MLHLSSRTFWGSRVTPKGTEHLPREDSSPPPGFQPLLSPNRLGSQRGLLGCSSVVECRAMHEALSPTTAQTNKQPKCVLQRECDSPCFPHRISGSSSTSPSLHPLQLCLDLPLKDSSNSHRQHALPTKPHLTFTLPGTCSLASPLLLSDPQPGWCPLQGLLTLHPCPVLTALTPEVSIPFLRQAHPFTTSTCLLLREKAWCFQPQGL